MPIRNKPPPLTPPVQPPPVRLEYLASRGEDGAVQGLVVSRSGTAAASSDVLLLHSTQTGLRRRVSSGIVGSSAISCNSLRR